jgi:apolipoprotein N-acyltransferase
MRAEPMPKEQKRARHVAIALACAVSGATLPWILIHLLRTGYAVVATAVVVGLVAVLILLLARAARRA